MVKNNTTACTKIYERTPTLLAVGDCRLPRTPVSRVGPGFPFPPDSPSPRSNELTTHWKLAEACGSRTQTAY
jgi:hypothetical protein